MMIEFWACDFEIIETFFLEKILFGKSSFGSFFLIHELHSMESHIFLTKYLILLIFFFKKSLIIYLF